MGRVVRIKLLLQVGTGRSLTPYSYQVRMQCSYSCAMLPQVPMAEGFKNIAGKFVCSDADSGAKFPAYTSGYRALRPRQSKQECMQVDVCSTQ